MNIKYKIIDEDTNVYYVEDAQLSYKDFGDTRISLYINKEYEGECKVWLDSEMDEREYIILNHTIVYLDTIEKI